jgi:CheY-like chemotaxis protein
VTKVLVVDDDDSFGQWVVRALDASGNDTVCANSVGSALELLNNGTDPEVLITDLDLSSPDGKTGLDLIRIAKEQRPELQAILMSAVASARDYKTAMAVGAVDVLVKPFSPTELRNSVSRAIECDQTFHGEVHGVNLPELLQLYHFSRRSLTIVIEGRTNARIHMVDGDIVDVRCGDKSGEEGLCCALATSGGNIQTVALEEYERSIHQPFDESAPQAEDTDILDGFDESFDNFFGDAKATLEDVKNDSDREETSTTRNNETGARTVGKIDDTCKQVVDKTDGAIACGVVDLDTGMLLGVHNNANYTQSLNEIVAAAAVDMFRGANVGRIEKAVRAHRGQNEDGAHYIEEIQFSSKNNYHFAKSIKGNRAVIILVTTKATNIGMGWASLKSVISEVEPLVP